MEFAQCLLRQAEKHPSLQAQDVLKLCYQAAFGAAHLRQQLPQGEKRFYEEFAATPADAQALSEPISPALCRVNLSAWKRCKLPPAWLFRLCGLTEEADGGARARFLLYCGQVRELAQAGKLPVTEAAWEAQLRQFDGAGRGPVHHSESYRQAEAPAYRLAPAWAVRLFPLLQRLAALPEKPVSVLAMDGRTASGKSTMAAQLAVVLQAGVAHMDDFFLPQSLRTTARLSVPGGNVHYERFIQEILPYLRKANAFSYRKFDCGSMDFAGQREVPVGRWRIVEGSYSMHPKFGRYWDTAVFSTVNPQEQLERICRRNGAQAAALFETHWIPLEEAYFADCRTAERADLTL